VAGFGPTLEEPREESPGEAQVRLAEWFVTLVGFFGIRYYPFEREAQAKAIGPWIRRWPRLAKFGMKKK
jgi:hypothetical protein